ncbi:uncharacterized protein TRUGW13939_01320 [Talaromyces rugulosus]|uniref:Cytochrome b5 heme-binding domain-containing protein n=1 Tax=Talaromyces rugulosus TaxID=121627 RepID=A0A7H8QL57_TALRU|nr:uncharacterized protein TRUGW13939_01320 [Talaromyces rugulosus]QKX54235.1 hypothetical protein TRUGW13939_01320 [Talaromyces rugulosus]
MEYATSPKDKSLESPPLQEPPTKIYALSEIAQHNRLDDIWVIIDGNVYDLTNFVSEHPGGGKILQGVAGKDATKKFNKYHRPALISRYEARLKIGQVQLEQSVEKKSKFRIRLNFASHGGR